MNSRTLQLAALKHHAMAMRSDGKTISEIQAELGPISKGTLSHWLKRVELTDEQKQRIKEIARDHGQVGRLTGAWANHQRRIERLAAIRETAEADYDRLTEIKAFLPGLVLYLAEGTKKTEQFHFMNSNPYLIHIMIGWILLVSELQLTDLRFRLYIHEQYADENCELFWQNELRAGQEYFLKTIFKPSQRVYKKNPAYKGCLRIEVKGSELYWKTMTWRDCLYRSMV